MNDEKAIRESTKIEVLHSSLRELKRTQEKAEELMLRITGREDEVSNKDHAPDENNICFLEIWEKTPHLINEHCKVLQSIFIDLHKLILN